MKGIWLLSGSGNKRVVGGRVVHFSSYLKVQLFSSLCIVNDELIVGNARTKEMEMECHLHSSSLTLCKLHAYLLPETAGNDAGFLCLVWDKPPVVSEVSL